MVVILIGPILVSVQSRAVTELNNVTESVIILLLDMVDLNVSVKAFNQDHAKKYLVQVILKVFLYFFILS